MGTNTLAGQRHTVAWPAGSRGWGARGRRIETRGSHHIIARPVSRQIGFPGSGVRVMIEYISFKIVDHGVNAAAGYKLFVVREYKNTHYVSPCNKTVIRSIRVTTKTIGTAAD